jgi:hypothetical protein
MSHLRNTTCNSPCVLHLTLCVVLQDPSTPPPLFIFDEANILAEWPDDKKMERRALLRFFVLVSVTSVMRKSDRQKSDHEE